MLLPSWVHVGVSVGVSVGVEACHLQLSHSECAITLLRSLRTPKPLATIADTQLLFRARSQTCGPVIQRPLTQACMPIFTCRTTSLDGRSLLCERTSLLTFKRKRLRPVRTSAGKSWM